METEAVLGTLVSRGWCFRNPAEIKSLIQTLIPPSSSSSSSSSSSPSSSSSSSLASAVESELLNLDLRSIGGRSIPDQSSAKKPSHLNGPKVLQLVSMRDIYQSSIDASFRNSLQHRRLLRFVLTDGHSEVTAIEYAPIPRITEEIIPGTKVRLENSISMRSGILCLNPNVMAVMGGLVPSLYEEWQMSQKYSGFSRTSLRLSQNDNGGGPPPFEKLQIGVLSSQVARCQVSHDLPESTMKYSSDKSVGRQEAMNHGHHVGNKGLQANITNTDKGAHDPSMVSSGEKTQDNKPCSSEARPKEVSEAVPVQNQAAAQKLLQKMSQPTDGDRHLRGHRHRLKGKHEEEQQVFTLDEWERRKSSNSNYPLRKQIQDISRDEELARQLQNQLDLEDFHGKPENAEAERIRMSMFNFGRAEERRDEPRGRGRGRGRRGRRY